MASRNLMLLAVLGFLCPVLGALCSRVGRSRPSSSAQMRQAATFVAGLAAAYGLVRTANGVHPTQAVTIIIVGALLVVCSVTADLASLTMGFQAVRSGALIFAFSLGMTAGLFILVGFDRFTLENGATVLSCIFGIIIAFYFLNKMPEPKSERRSSQSAGHLQHQKRGFSTSSRRRGQPKRK